MSIDGSVTRRSILRRGAAVLGICAGSSTALAQRGSTATTPLEEFGYRQVEFGPGPMERQFRANHQLLLGLNEDSLLRPFRLREGLPAPGAELGGWYDTYGFAPAASFGQWMSALARYYAATGDEATRAKVSRLVRGYAATISPAGKFYVENRFPSYIYDKLVCGLIDAHTYAKDPIALSNLQRATDAAAAHLPEKAFARQETPVVAREDFTRHCWDESYTLPENLFLAWKRTGNPRYRKMAERLLFDGEFFDPLSRGENVLPGKHAYSHVNALSSAAAAYLLLGSEKHLRAAHNGFAMVEEQSYATGGWGPDEHFFEPGSGKLGESLRTTHSSFETPCGAYAHFKITRYLLRITGDSQYGDSMERVLYNTVLGAKPIQPNGSAFYYSDYNFDAHKTVHPDKWPCCSGTLPQLAADYRISSYFRDSRGVFVNLYAPSKATWVQSGATCVLQQTTSYPFDSRVQIELTASTPATFSVFVRVPAWAKGARVSVNNLRNSPAVTPGTFAEIRREWKTGDRIELDLPLAMRLEPVDRQHNDTVALLSGPLVLFGTEGSDSGISGKALLSAQRASASSRVWTASETRLKPFMDIGDEKYRTYFRLADA